MRGEWQVVEALPADPPKFAFVDEYGNTLMQAFFGGSSLPILGDRRVDPAKELCVNVLLDDSDDAYYEHFCSLEQHIEEMQALVTTLRAWDQDAYRFDAYGIRP